MQATLNFQLLSLNLFEHLITSDPTLNHVHFLSELLDIFLARYDVIDSTLQGLSEFIHISRVRDVDYQL